MLFRKATENLWSRRQLFLRNNLHAYKKSTYTHEERVRLRVSEHSVVDDRPDIPQKQMIGGRLIPLSDPVSQEELDQLAHIISSSRRTAVLTGAGVSTASGIPDYRGPGGAYTTGYQPMSHQKFMGTEKSRSRYWARNFAGWEQFKTRPPNDCHISIAELQRRNWVDFIVTQNVDRLHHSAGSKNIVELHGTTHEVMCTDCGIVSGREEFQSVLASLNPYATSIIRKNPDPSVLPNAESFRDPSMVRPDGDIDIFGREKGFRVPPCNNCGGVLKPNVVFFGDSVPAHRANECYIPTSYRLVLAAVEGGAKIVIVNIGETRADNLCHLKIERVAGEVFSRLEGHPLLITPRPQTHKSL